MVTDFTLKKYSELCNSLINNGYDLITVSDYLKKTNHPRSKQTKIAIIRHDVDRNILNAQLMAKMEQDMGVRSTYYFRYPTTFHRKAIIEIMQMGHEVGYHYETLSKAKGDIELAAKLFKEELERFNTIPGLKIETACMHGSPLSKYDNKDIWKYFKFEHFNIIGEAYVSMEGMGLIYLTDTGRAWDNKNSIRDSLPNSPSAGLRSTDDVIKYVNNKTPSQIYITTHPKRWAINGLNFIKVYMRDAIFNNIKKLI